MDKKVIDIKKEKKKPNYRANWLQIRTEYETNPITLADLAAKYNVSHSRIRKVAMEEKWSKYKTEVQDKLAAEIREKVINSSVINAEYILSELKKIAEKEGARDSDKLKALELLGKSIGIFKDTVNLNTSGEVKKLEDIICQNDL